MNEKEKKLIEMALKAQERNKKNNEHIKNTYDRISVTLPKGTKERIQAANETINSLVNRLVLEYLDSKGV